MAFAAFGVFCGAQDPYEAVRTLASVLPTASSISNAGIGVFGVLSLRLVVICNAWRVHVLQRSHCLH